MDEVHVTKSKCGIMDDLNKYNFDDEIKLRADYIYINLKTSSKRKSLRLECICYCIYQAYLDVGHKIRNGSKSITIEELSSIIGLNVINAKKAILSYAKFNQLDFKNMKITGIREQIESICENNNLDNMITQLILKMYDDYKGTIIDDTRYRNIIAHSLICCFLINHLYIKDYQQYCSMFNVDYNKVSEYISRYNTT